MSNTTMTQTITDSANTSRRTHTHQLTHRRTRTCSIISTASSSSFKSILEIPSTSSAVGGLSEKHDICGSFVPNGSATASLRNLASFQYQPFRQPSSTRRRREIIPPIEKHSSSVSSSDDEGDVTVVTRPVVPSFSRSQLPQQDSHPVSTTSSFSTKFLAPKKESQTDLHPILASLERKSKLCTKRIYCSTCNKPGTDYPRCGKCGEMWCSRECRLQGGKRHVC